MDDNQRFGQGDVALLDGKFKVKIVMPIQDEDNSWWYEVESLELDTFHREVKDSQLAPL